MKNSTKLSNGVFENTQSRKAKRIAITVVAAFITVSLTGCGGSSYDDPVDSPTPETPAPPPVVKQFQQVLGVDKNTKSHPLLSLNPGGPGGSSNQSLRAGDVLMGGELDDIIIGGLGVDVLLGYDGDDILIGGTEDFNSNVDGDDNGSDNRDRALGHDGDDAFIWAPGDGSDFFDGGDGIDVVIFGILGEASDADGNTDGAPFFAVNPPSGAGSQDFDGIFLDENYQPVVSVSGSPGFCSVVDAVENQAAFSQLNIDNVVRFSLRNFANQFDAGDRPTDDGLRVAVTLKNTEYLVCTKRELDADNATNNIEVINISGDTPVVAAITDLPQHIQAILQ